jgi:hypothetical protein
MSLTAAVKMSWDLQALLGRTVPMSIGRPIAASLILGVVLGLVVEGASATTRFDRDGIAVHVPPGWSLTLGRINAVIDPVTIFTVSAFRLPPGGTSSGICSVRLRRAWRADGGYLQLAEERDGASRRRMLRRVPHRPRHFALDAKGRGGLCTPPDSGELPFQTHSRAFYLFYGFGRKAPKRIRAQAEALLDGMRISRRR